MSASPTLALLLDQAAAAEAELGRRIEITDAASEPKDDVWAEQFAACDALSAIALEICGYRPANDDETEAKITFLLKWWHGCSPQPDEMRALLGSMRGGAQ